MRGPGNEVTTPFDEVLSALRDKSVVQGSTQARVLRALAQNKERGVRRDLAEYLNMSAGTVSKALQPAKLRKDKSGKIVGLGLVEEGIRRPEARQGAPLLPLSLSSTRFAMMGISVISGPTGPSHLLGTVLGLDGTPFPGFEKPKESAVLEQLPDPDGTRLVDALARFASELRSSFENSISVQPDHPSKVPPRLLGCGINLSGHVDHDLGIVRTTGWGAEGPWELEKKLKDELGMMITVDNDCTSLAVLLNLLPHTPQDDPGESYALLAVLEQGVGGAVVQRGYTRRGHDNMAAEPGHLPVGHVVAAFPEGDKGPPDDLMDAWSRVPVCKCRPEGIGHVQTFASPAGIVSRAEDLELIDKGSDPSEFRKLAAQYHTDPNLSRLFHQGGVALGHSIVSAINWINPGKIIVYLPPVLAQTTDFGDLLVGSHYRKGLESEVHSTAFVDYADDRLVIIPLDEDDLKDQLTAGAAYLVLARLLEKLAETDKTTSQADSQSNAMDDQASD